MPDPTTDPSPPVEPANPTMSPSAASGAGHQDKGKSKADDQEVPAHDPTILEEDELDEDADGEARLKMLATAIRDQDDLERDIGRQADQILNEQADEREQKRMDKTEGEKQRYITQVKRLEQRLKIPAGQSVKNKIRQDIAHAEARIEELDIELKQIQARVEDRRKNGAEAGEQAEVAGNQPLPNETRREFLIRTGKITPFSKLAQVPTISDDLGDVMLDAEAAGDEEDESTPMLDEFSQGPVSHRNLMNPGFADETDSSSPSPPSTERPSKRRRVASSSGTPASTPAESPGGGSDDAFDPEMDTPTALEDSADEQGEDSGDDYVLDTPPRKRKAPVKKSKATGAVEEKEDLAGVDDGNEKVYESRLKHWAKSRSEARTRAKAKRATQADEAPATEDDANDPDEEEWYKPHPTRADVELEGGLRIPGDIYPSLFDYQKTGVQWLGELYSQQVGGIIGDEMGLGKTIQIISFLAGLHYSKKITKPIIVVTPATVMKNWVNEFHRWWPPMRVSILHSSGSGMMDTRRESQMERELESRSYDDERKPLTKAAKAAKKIVDKVKRDGHVLITTYSGLQSYAEFLVPTDWEYAVLDEGHKIRNPNTAITIFCKELRTPNRVILSGTPMQNNLTELWSLFDFVFPMRLGTLVRFRNSFEFPIKKGGYANASNLDVETAMRCAETLKESISPYLLQRFKVDVAADLPKKSERVLFCKLTRQQREAYEQFLASDDMNSILNGKRQMLFGIDILRKICNHPDLVQHKTLSKKEGFNYGSGVKSGKMQVVKALLEIWKKDGHKTLLFAQHRIMLDILEKFVKGMKGDFKYRRMDGNTAIKDRQAMVDEFNNDPDLHVFLLTTKVGGLGVNLTGADRVIIFDPDWNPSTDIQARERAWRLGQKREVEIYRLMTAGTIEEKIYHRQIFKQFLTNKILRDPKQRQTFQLRDLQDLFSLGSANDGETETSNLFRGSEVKFNDQGAGAAPNRSMPTPPTDPESLQLQRAHNGASTGTSAQNLEAITGVSRQEAYAPEESDSSDNANDDPEASKEKGDRLLSTIFARSGVHSALEHDVILNSRTGKPKYAPDPKIIAQEARKVAAEAARELQRSAEIARTIPAGVPTWTGVVGVAGRPQQRLPPPRNLGAGRGGGRGGPSSSSVLSNLATRQGQGGAGRGRGAAATTQNQQPKGRDFLELIRDFINVHGGKVHTQALINQFNRFCGTAQRTAEFKAMLNEIAVLERGTGGRGKWTLKEEYKTRRG
ncbi:hypothetical protein BU16DRAFT_523354 [Lophium mytilinum]|uniref:DNA repair and recombination protein RAD26 n=1 Tax=Lophium mytilinum TaxID=390894 RepID=A0A6A6R7Y2_9PEZI|nr:hypothetical protein BU16DRAFT_523354 [Lophium mytilinum]